MQHPEPTLRADPTLCVAVLTGRRPALLVQTLDSFEAACPDVWSRAAKVVVHNSGDRDTADVLDRWSWDARSVHDGPLLPIATASDRLIGLAASTGCDVTLRLEDDWTACRGGWLDAGLTLLDDCKQVRLRVETEPVMGRCWVCRRPLRWEPHRSGRIAPDGHYTHNPSLVRTSDLVAIRGYARERDAAARFHPSPIGQVVPGVFAHAGHREAGLSLKHTQGAA